LTEARKIYKQADPPHPNGKRKKDRGSFLAVTATALEMRAVLAALPGGSDINIAEYSILIPQDQTRPALPALRLAEHDLAILICGVGPVAAALTLGFYLGVRQDEGQGKTLDGVINFGFAGSYDLERAPEGALVLVDAETFPEYGVWPESGEHSPAGANTCGNTPKQYRDDLPQPGFPLPLPLPQTRLERGPIFTRIDLEPDQALAAMGLCLGKQEKNRHNGKNFISAAPTLSGAAATLSGVSGTPRRAARMAALSGALVENMEGFALAMACAAAGIAFIELRAVSNAAGKRPPQGWDFTAAGATLSRAAVRLLGRV
jgi:futalosine hydrolase